MAQPRIPFLAMLNFLDLSKLTNDLVCHDLVWNHVPTKLNLHVLKFEGKNGEDPGDHVTTFHLCSSSNLLNHDYVLLQVFQCTLMGSTTKWYIDLCGGTYRTLNDLPLVLLNHFQLPVHYNVGIKLLSTFQQDKGTHIQEWRK